MTAPSQKQLAQAQLDYWRAHIQRYRAQAQRSSSDDRELIEDMIVRLKAKIADLEEQLTRE